MQSFGVKLVYYDRHQKPEIEAMGAEHFSDLEEFVGRCDIVAINVRCLNIAVIVLAHASLTVIQQLVAFSAGFYCPCLGCGHAVVQVQFSATTQACSSMLHRVLHVVALVLPQALLNAFCNGARCRSPTRPGAAHATASAPASAYPFAVEQSAALLSYAASDGYILLAVSARPDAVCSACQDARQTLCPTSMLHSFA